MCDKKSIRILFVVREQYPTFRADVACLFGKYLPRHDVLCDFVSDIDEERVGKLPEWAAGKVIGVTVPKSALRRQSKKFLNNFFTMMRINAGTYDAIQVRDLPVTALVGLLIAKIKGVAFYYWMSFPQSEAQIARAMKSSNKWSLEFWFPLVQGSLGVFVLRHIVLRYATRVFVQSERMREDLAAEGIERALMTAVPMGVDMELVDELCRSGVHADIPRNRKIAVYLGVLDPERRSEFLLEALKLAIKSVPDIYLIIVGGAADEQYARFLQAEIVRLGLHDHVRITGWLPMEDAWRYVRGAQVGLSPFPRGDLLDSASPTKAIEYLAMGVPVVANDQPEQAALLESSKAGMCVAMTPEGFASAICEILSNPMIRDEMARRGPQYVRSTRSYAGIGGQLAQVYKGIGSSLKD